ncbi:Putative DMT superfamily metabolite efflux protein precursor [Salmonella enterica subsp. arizonae]|uniref:DMT superfamily metabolite efflux protein n=1 Tax=Salmonella enterica subsp. arizonae TaxID=59203 RepID=A0A3S4GN61_SALER|nr:Putative DMT superfamily metabolite efflux protein precursor [Salmonella enterica subsp. arizonae]
MVCRWGDELSILSVDSDGAVRYCSRAGVHRSSGGRAVFIPAAGRFIWVVLAVLGLWFLLPLGQDVSHVDLTGAALALGAGACWAVYILTGQRAGAEHGPATVAVGSLIAALIFVPIGAVQAGDALWHWSILPLGLAVAVLSTALPYSLEMIALTRLPTRTFGTLMSMEPALAAVSGMIFLGETLTGVQMMALCAIIAASMGSTLTIRREPQIKQIEVK